MSSNLIDFVNAKRLNFAKFIRENTINNKDVVEHHLTKMLVIDPILFLQFVKFNASGKSEEEMVTALLEEVGMKETDFNPEAKPKFLAYVKMFCELLEQ